MARVQILKETNAAPEPSGSTLAFQWCRYIYDDGDIEHGYRFIWRRPPSAGGALQAARGQARIPSIAVLEKLVTQAKTEGWGHYDASTYDASVQAALREYEF